MKTLNKTTVTEGRMERAITDAVNRVAGPQLTQQINDSVENERIRTGVITKFYPYLDKAEVDLDNTNDTILCKILHRFNGDLIDFYTPLAAEESFDDDLHEPYIVPKAAQNVLVINIHDADSEENLILGYYNNEEIVGFTPAPPGNMKLLSTRETNLFHIEFGVDGLDLRLPSPLKTNVGEMPADMVDVDYADANDTYTKEEVYNKDEVYTKEEVDELIHNLLIELQGEDTDDTTG